ncbi:MAG: threonylcarbamoyl-AMP synthase [Chloroflexi bacterium]|nr:threonylcarbamoyl-AMP synthase [Chloroflexota bacterium]
MSDPLVLPATDPVALEEAAAALEQGDIVGIPTETVYGIGVRPAPDPLRALITAKHRDEGKGIALLVDGLDQVTELVTLPDAAHRLADRFWPGALTLVLPLRPGVVLPTALTGGRPTLGIRLPDHSVPRTLARRLGPLAVTSANRSGEPEARTAAELVASVGDALALVLDDGPVRGGVASTVVALDVDGRPTVLRPGALDPGLLTATLG